MNLRNARPDDWPYILEEHKRQNERDGTSYPLPLFFTDDGRLRPNIPVALVVEDDAGNILQSIYIETTAELCFSGTNPRATAYAERDMESLVYLLQQHGLTEIHSCVPSIVAAPIGKPLTRAGFTRRDDLVYFARDIRPNLEGETN